MFYMDLDEVDALHRKLKLFSHKTFNFFSFHPNDYIVWNTPFTDAKSQLLSYLSEKGVDTSNIHKVHLLAHVRTLGYVFNPVSFYFCTQANGHPIVSVALVTNTFHERKPYIIPYNPTTNTFTCSQTKYFYVSPFLNHDSDFYFHIHIPHENLAITVNNMQNNLTQFKSGLSGRAKKLNDTRLLYYFCYYPLVTLKVIAAIHWQAFLLWLKNIPYFRKQEFPELQRDILPSADISPYEHR